MKIATITLFLTLTAHLFIGYYTPQGIHDEGSIFFFKKHPTLQLKFKNIYTKDEDPKPLSELNMIEINTVIEYCKYRLGIETQLESESALESCKAR